MSSLIEDLLKIVPLIAGVSAITRFVITTTNKTSIELILTPKNTKIWENFYELVILSVIISAGLFIPSLVVINPAPEQFLNILTGLDIILFIISFFIGLIIWITSWFVKVSDKRKLIEISVIGNFILVILFMFLVVASLKDDLNNNLVEKKYLEIITFYFVCTIIIFILFHMYRAFYRHLINPKQEIYRIQVIEVDKINDELCNLYFKFTIDNERHVLSRSLKNKGLELPIYVYYPKEHRLIQYVNISED